MKIFKNNAELYFREVLASIKPSKANWTASLFHPSAFKTENKSKELEKFLFGLLTDKFAEKEAYVFFCNDDDVIALLPGNSIQGNIVKTTQKGAKGFVGEPFARAKLLHCVAQSPHCSYLPLPTHIM